MGSSYDVIEVTLASAVANAATFTATYPDNTDAGDYEGGWDHRVVSMPYGDLKITEGDFTISFGATAATITNTTGQTFAAGTTMWVQLDKVGGDGQTKLANVEKMSPVGIYTINLGAPDAADANGVVESQAITAAGGLATGINGALASGGVATFDVPRNVVAAWTGTAVMTVTGTDVYGNTVVESSASGTSLAGKKAFKTVTGVSVSADVTGATVGTGDVLGLPVFLPDTGLILAELQAGAAATAGTKVAGVTTPATATTGDVRGTYDPNSACNGTLTFQLVVALPDPSFKGIPQYAG